MSCSSGPNIIEDGLVFYYDISNHKKSWKGMPTTNIVTNWDLNTGWSQNYNTDIQWNDYPAPDGINAPVVSFVDLDGNGSGYWFSYGDYAPQQPSTTYSVSVYARTIGSDWSIRAYTADNTEVGRQWTESLVVPGDGKWHRLEFNPFTTPADTQSDSLSFNFLTMPAGQRFWLCAPQMTATNFHVPFVGGTRSNTEALLDMTNKNIIIANEITYKSNGLFDFTGTNDYASFGDGADIHDMGSNITVEAWVKYNNYASTNGQSYSVVTCKGTQWTWLMENPSNKLRFRIHAGGIDTNIASPNIHPLNTWIHCVGTYDGTTMRIYENGVETNSKAQTGALGITTNTAKIGCYTPTSYSIDGEIAIVKIHNVTLTDNEIKQNFNTLKSRFGL